MPFINEKYEIKLVLKIQNIEKALLGLTTKDIRRLAYDFAIRMRNNHRFSNKSKMADGDWLRSFMSRHPELAIPKPGRYEHLKSGWI